MGDMMIIQSFAIGGSRSSFACGDATCWKGMTKGKSLKFTANTLALGLEWNGYSGWVIFLAAISESDVEQQVHLGDQTSKFIIASLPPL